MSDDFDDVRRAGIRQREFGLLPDGRVVHEYTIDNGAGLSLSAISLGGIVTALRAPDRHGRAANVVLGFAGLADYAARNPHFGTIVGRYANRIAGGRLVIDGESFQLDRNEGSNSLHGGRQGFGTRWWNITPHPGELALDLERVSEDGEQGYPGRLQVQVRYTLTPRGEWRIDYRAACDRATVVNLSHHDYFNLAGAASAMDHRLLIAASHYCAVDAGLIPQEIESVEGTPLDFREERRIGDRIRDAHPQLVRAHGYDHNWILDADARGGLRFAARLSDPVSGRVMDVHTTEPGLQFYSGNFLDGSLVGPASQAYRQGDGLCLETQHFPDSPNHPAYPSTLLRPGEIFSSSTVHSFGVLRDLVKV